MLDPFLGTWRLIPDRSRYQQGTPPRDGLYRLEPWPGGVRFTIDWVDAAGDSHHLQHELELGDRGDVSLVVDGDVLATTVRRDGRVVAHATRKLSVDRDRLDIVQTVVTADGQTFANVSCYERVD